ncbi:MAG: putative RNA-binding protein (virulence factor B family) [Polyangiales bacterium]|jgi:predicted RNA-binding protein (virulence factor B family)
MTYQIGQYNTLEVRREEPQGFYLGGEAHDEQVLLPGSLAYSDTEIGESIEVFVYTDSEDRPVATTQRPTAVVGDFAFLSVIDVAPHGAFLDWGLDKDLFAPNNEQVRKLEIGDQFVFAVSLDKQSGRVKATSQLKNYLDYDVSNITEGQSVDVLVYDRNPLGMLVVVEGRHPGLIYKNEAFQPLRVGQTMKAYVQLVRPDNKLDIRLQRSGAAAIDDAQLVLLDALVAAPDGFLPLHDKSPPEDIRARLQISKKAFKKALGGLYRARRVELKPEGIQLIRDKD